MNTLAGLTIGTSFGLIAVSPLAAAALFVIASYYLWSK